jgi:Mg2+ and Co2+ transporter CorA
MMSDLMGLEQKKKRELEEEMERKRQMEDTQSVFEIRKLFKFGNDFQEFIKSKERAGASSKKISASRPVSAYTTNLMDQINDKFNKIVTQVKDNTQKLKEKLDNEDKQLQKDLTIG